MTAIIKYPTAVITVALISGLLTCKADANWALTYQPLFGKFVLWPMFLPEATESLNKLETMLGDKSVPENQKAEVEFWLLAVRNVDESMCTGEYEASLGKHSVGSFGIHRLRNEVRRKLYLFCMERYLPEIRPWANLNSVEYLTDDIGYNAKVPHDVAAKRLKVMLNRRPDWLEHKVFNLRVSKEENYERFKRHYDSNVPCKDSTLLSFINHNHDFMSYIIRPKVTSRMDRVTKEVFRKVLACEKYNELEDDVRRQVFEEILSELLSWKNTQP